MMQKVPKYSFITIFLTAFIDMLGIGLVIPVFGHLFLDAAGILPEGYLLSQRTVMLGLLIASYPFMQFFGAPILGALSDRHGRKKILMISLFGTFLGYLLFAYGLITRNLPLVFFSRMLDGFTGGNISTILSSIADISDPKEKAKNFGLVGMAFGVGFILGPFIGGILSDPGILPWFTSSTPFFFAAVLTALNIIFVIFLFGETSATRTNSHISIFTGFKNIRNALKMRNLRTMFLVIFLFTFGFNFFTQFFQVYLIEKFSYTQSQIGNLFAYMGLWIAVTQGVLTRFLSKRFLPYQIIRMTLLALSVSLTFLLLPNNPVYLFLVLPFIAISNGLTHPNSTAIISNLGAKDSQGEILGINQSIQSLGMTIPPIISGFIAYLHISLPIIIGSACLFLSWLAFMLTYRPEEKKIFHEV
jgi:MFS transporter, DHA1 family, tetracycline resistance protein